MALAISKMLLYILYIYVEGRLRSYDFYKAKLGFLS